MDIIKCHIVSKSWYLKQTQSRTWISASHPAAEGRYKSSSSWSPRGWRSHRFSVCKTQKGSKKPTNQQLIAVKNISECISLMNAFWIVDGTINKINSGMKTVEKTKKTGKDFVKKEEMLWWAKAHNVPLITKHMLYPENPAGISALMHLLQDI